MMMRNLKSILLLSSFATIIAITSSCKDPLPPKAKIIVVDQEGEPVNKATVIIKASSSDSAHTVIYLADGPKKIADTTITESEGIVEKEFLYPSIYRVEVTKPSTYNQPIRRGVGVLILEEDKTIEEKITITPQTNF